MAFKIIECIFWGLVPKLNSVIKVDSDKGYICIERGLLRKYTEYVNLFEIKNIHLRQSFSQSLFNLGNINIETCDITFTFQNVKNAHSIADELRSISLNERRQYIKYFY